MGDWLEETFGDINIEDLPIRFGCVAADISTGREVWLRKGPLVPALRASTALPGLFPSVGYEGRWLSDGGLANPVPVSLARSMGADFVIAVDLDSEMTPYDPPMNNHPGAQVSDDKPSRSWVDRMTNSLPDAVRSRAADLVEAVRQPSDKGPGYLELVTRSLHIMMHRITRSRLAGDPPEALILPRLEGIGVLEFSRAVDAEAEGRQAVHRARPALFDLMRRHDGSGAGEDAHTPIDIGEVR
ncbi:MAG: patatin-like phospholipase family protein [Pseudomonadota bacterium]